MSVKESTDKTNGGFVNFAPWDWAEDFQEGLARVEKGGKYGYIDKTGALVIPCEFDNAGAFHEGLAVVHRDGKRGVIDKDGNLLFATDYSIWNWFINGMARIADWSSGKLRFGWIDKNGKIVSPCIWTRTYVFSEGLAAVTAGGKSSWGYIDKCGEIVIPCVWDNAKEFSEGLAAVKKTINGDT